MSKADFQKKVRDNDGYILSDGTLNFEHLFHKAYDFIIGWGIRSMIPSEILEVYKFDEGYKPESKDDASLGEIYYYGHCEIPDEKLDDASYLWNEVIVDFFNHIAPLHYYFGSSYGDGACIGWFKEEEEGF